MGSLASLASLGSRGSLESLGSLVRVPERYKRRENYQLTIDN